ncbi:MAG: 50S ribosomal protein L30 [Myxococcota bacterium]
MSASKTIKVTLKRGLSGCDEKQRATVKGLGLKRRHQTVELENTPSVRGMVKKVIHLLEVDE